MKKITGISILLFIMTGVSLMLSSSCDKEDEKEAICFTVSGFNVSVNHLWNSGMSETVNLQGLLSTQITISSGGETHNLLFSSIVNNYQSYYTQSFNATIDGKSYSYPQDECD
jgi:hypothetical protein